MRARAIQSESTDYRLRLLLTALAFLGLLWMTAARAEAQTAPAREVVGPSADTITPYRPAGRDPFKRTVKPKTSRASNKDPRMPRPVGFPTLEVRRAEFRQKVEMARSRDLPEPDPVAQYLVGEVEVTGVFRDERGYGAFVRATPTGTMFFVRRGTKLYNGEVVGIEDDSAEAGVARVMFREVSYVEHGGKQIPQERVVAKVPAAVKADRK